MVSRKRLVFSVALLLSVTLLEASAQGLPPLTHNLTAIDKPAKAPALALQNMDKEVIDITSMKGQVVVVNFWATWCPPCRREMASLERLYQSTKDQKVKVIAVNIGEDEDTVFSFLGTIETFPNFTILYDTNAATMASWKIKGLPTTYIVGPDGYLKYRAVGGREFDHPEIQQTITKLLKSAE